MPWPGDDAAKVVSQKAPNSISWCTQTSKPLNNWVNVLKEISKLKYFYSMHCVYNHFSFLPQDCPGSSRMVSPQRSVYNKNPGPGQDGNPTMQGYRIWFPGTTFLCHDFVGPATFDFTLYCKLSAKLQGRPSLLLWLFFLPFCLDRMDGGLYTLWQPGPTLVAGHCSLLWSGGDSYSP